MSTGSWSWAVLGAGTPAWQWGARSVGGSRDPIPTPIATCPAPFPNNPWHRLPSLQRPVRKLLSLPASLWGPGTRERQHLCTAVPSLLFVWYVEAVGTFLLIL